MQNLSRLIIYIQGTTSPKHRETVCRNKDNIYRFITFTFQNLSRMNEVTQLPPTN